MYKGEMYDLLDTDLVTVSSGGNRNKITFTNCVQEVTYNRDG